MRATQVTPAPEVTFDPKLTIIRTKETGADFYDAVMRRIGSEGESRGGVMFHFSGSFQDEFFVVSAYRDPADAAAMFADYTAPEVANAARETDFGADITRLEFPITRYVVRDDEDLQGFRHVQDGEFIAVYVTDDAITRENYVTTTHAANFPKVWPEGMVIHVAGEFGSRWGIFDIWRAGSDLRAFYEDRIERSLQRVLPDVDSTIARNPQAITLHSLYISRSNFGDVPEYLRDE